MPACGQSAHRPHSPRWPRWSPLHPPAPAIGALVCYSFSFYLLSLILRSLPVGIAYALWSGVGIIGISLIGWFFMNQKLDAAAMAGIALIIAGVLVINLFSQSGAH